MIHILLSPQTVVLPSSEIPVRKMLEQDLLKITEILDGINL
jgi:hypothetical protein